MGNPGAWAKMRADTECHMAAATFLPVPAAQQFAAVQVIAKNIEALGVLEDALGPVIHLELA